MTDPAWKEVRAAAAAVGDLQTHVQRKGGWTADQAKQEAQRLMDACKLPDETTSLRSLLEILLMRERFEISEALSPEAQFQLVEVMWLRNWSGDDVRAAIPAVLDRLEIEPRSLQNAIQALLEIGYRYRTMAQPDRWPNREARAACAEVIWLTGLSENDAFREARAAMQRFELSRGNEVDALNALIKIELLYRRTPFDPSFNEIDRRRLAEIMWLRGWTLQQALEQAVSLRAALGITGTAEVVDALHQICLRCGGPAVPNRVTEAVDVLLKDTAATPEQRDLVRTQFGEYRWLQQSTTPQALEKIRRYASMTDKPLPETFAAALETARRVYRGREAAQE